MNLYTIKQFADICGVTYEAIRQRIESGTIKPIATNPTVINGDDYKDCINYLKLNTRNYNIMFILILKKNSQILIF